MSKTYFKSVPVFNFGRTLALLGLRAELAASLFLQVNAKEMIAGTIPQQ